MNLLELKTKFAEMSGRADLGYYMSSNQNYNTYSIYPENKLRSNVQRAGAEYYINAGQSYLDKEVELQEQNACFFIDLKAQEHTFMFPNVMKYVSQVLWNTTLLHQCAFDLRILQMLAGHPRSWCFAPTRSIFKKQKSQQLTAGYTWFNDDYTNCTDACTIIMILPKPTSAGRLSVMGKSMTPPLIEDTDTSVWTIKYPEVLLTASLMILESAYRNTEGVKDYKTSLDFMLNNIRNPQVEQEQTFLGEEYESF